jgi:hypothetical protein
MDQWMSTAAKKRWMQPTWLLAAFVVAVVWIGCQPKDESPGLWLRGESAEAHIEELASIQKRTREGSRDGAMGVGRCAVG